MVIKFDHRHKKLDGDLLLTTACPIECDFCVYSCTASKENGKWMPPKTIRRVAEQYSKNDIGVRISGGEPFYDLTKLKKCIDILLEYYKPNKLLIITSGFFGSDRKHAKKHLRAIQEFDTLVISTDRFHLKRVPLSNITNIIEVCEEMDIETVLRISLDSSSFDLMGSLSNIIVKHRIPIEVHDWGAVGKAEKLDSSVLKDFNKTSDYFFSKIRESAKKFNAPIDTRYYLTHSAKRSQRKYGSDFFPTTFPNGNVYACSMTMRGCYLGDINEENLLDMMMKWKNTLPGYFVLSDSSCQQLKNFLPGIDDRCEFCRNHPFDFLKEEAIGRKFVRVCLNNLDVLEFSEDREYLLSFQLSEKDLNRETGQKINGFLEKLKKNKIRFVLSRPLPKCLSVDVDFPKNCFECRELFTVEDNQIKYCGAIGKKGHRLEYVKDRKQVYDYFEIEHGKLKLPKKCESCLYFLRKVCNGMCFVEG